MDNIRREIATKLKIVAIGDSLTAGFPFAAQCSWVHGAAEALAINIINAGICGETTGDMLERFFADVVSRHASHAIIMGGSNDAFLGIYPEVVQDHIKQMVAVAREHAIEPILALPPPCLVPTAAEILDECRSEIRRFALSQQNLLIDFYSVFIDEVSGRIRQEYLPDGVHPNRTGYQRMAGVAIAQLETLLAR